MMRSEKMHHFRVLHNILPELLEIFPTIPNIH